MAYIDRDIFINNELIPLVKRLDLCHPKQKKGVLMAIQKLNEEPTADVVEVVRCKDCKYSVLLGNIEIDGIEEPCTIKCKYESYILGADDFCSLGERKDEKKKL